MNLFVDANIYLDFYHFSNDDLEELKKLVDLVNDGKITLILTTQVIDEVRRNRDNKVADAYGKFKNSKITLNLPQICKGYAEFPKILQALGILQNLQAKLDSKLIGDINKRTLKADKIINQLFDAANVIDSSKHLDKARIRFDLGNPPGKQRSYGDAVTWTALISELEDKNDIFFISDDIDYKSPLNELKFNPFLMDEWKTSKKSELFFYVKLSDFFNEHHKDIQLKVEEDKNKLIAELYASRNFAATHSLISLLSRYTSFTDEQIRSLSEIAAENNQVAGILSDSDVKDFYHKLLEDKEELIEPTVLEKIQKYMGSEEDEDCLYCRSGAVRNGEICPSCGNLCNI